MDINSTLLDDIGTHLYDYDCHSYEIEHFLIGGTPFLDRQREAIHIIEGIMTAHGKKELLRHVAELARVEHGIRELEPWVRDHVVHALLSFILGIYINEKFLRPKLTDPVNDFQWKLAGLLHDVGYPAQVAKDILKPFSTKINEIKRDLGVAAPDIFFKVVPMGLDRLTNGINAFDLIQDRLDGWELQIDARDEYNRMIHSGDICHGIVSSLAVLYVIDLMYQKYNPKRKYKDIRAVNRNISWNQTYFERDVVSACSAIYVHNLPTRCFTSAKIDRTKAPIAFLLKLSDCLQDWERPSLSDPNGLPATQFNIEVDNSGQLVFHADIQDSRKNEMKYEILSALDAPDVQICQ